MISPVRCAAGSGRAIDVSEAVHFGQRGQESAQPLHADTQLVQALVVEDNDVGIVWGDGAAIVWLWRQTLRGIHPDRQIKQAGTLRSVQLDPVAQAAVDVVF